MAPSWPRTRHPNWRYYSRDCSKKRRFLDYIRHFVLWESDDGYVKKIAGYHQFHAVNKAVEETIRASSPSGDKRIGVIWHTQGSGKSILTRISDLVVVPYR